MDSVQVHFRQNTRDCPRGRTYPRYASFRSFKIIFSQSHAEASTVDWRKSPAVRSDTAEATLQAYASMNPDAALLRIQGTRDGLSQDEASSRLKIKGPNLLSTKKPPKWWQLFLIILPNPFNILLALLGVISLATPPPSYSTFVLLMVMIIISCAVRFWQEYRSTIAAIKLQAGVSTNVRVRRMTHDKRPMDTTVDEKTLVPGDILLVDPGDSVPADCMVLKTSNLQVSQSRSVKNDFCSQTGRFGLTYLPASPGRVSPCERRTLRKGRS